MVELLKQDQFMPMTMADQVMVLFAATQGLIDDIPVESVKKFEQEFLRYMNDRKADIKKELGEKKAIDDALKAKLISAVEDFKKGFQA
jgi:F-type H+-transporting ATPase subunit alpha